jgi:hypothetical protein
MSTPSLARWHWLGLALLAGLALAHRAAADTPAAPPISVTLVKITGNTTNAVENVAPPKGFREATVTTATMPVSFNVTLTNESKLATPALIVHYVICSQVTTQDWGGLNPNTYAEGFAGSYEGASLAPNASVSFTTAAGRKGGHRKAKAEKTGADIYNRPVAEISISKATAEPTGRVSNKTASESVHVVGIWGDVTVGDTVIKFEDPEGVRDKYEKNIALPAGGRRHRGKKGADADNSGNANTTNGTGTTSDSDSASTSTGAE